MLLVPDDDMIEALVPDTPNQTLDVRVLPWTLRRDEHYVDAHVLDALPKGAP
jgi:hypothetical protein